MTSLDGKKVLVFGGSRGIGLGVAKAALERGAEVFIAGRSPEKLEAAEKSLGKSARVHAILGDMTKEADCRPRLQAGWHDRSCRHNSGHATAQRSDRRDRH